MKEPNDDFRHLRRVSYSERPDPKYLVDTNANEVLYTKGLEWEHEREWRIIRNFNDAAVKVGPDKYGKDVLLFAIPPDCIQSVIIGYRAQPETVEKMRAIVRRDKRLAHVTFQELILDDGSITLPSE